MPALTIPLTAMGDILRFGSKANLIALGVLLMIVGILFKRAGGKHDLKGMAVDAAWQTAKARGHTPTELEAKVREVVDEESNVRRAKLVAGHAARHVWGQVLGMVGWAAILIGLLLAGSGWLWR